MSFEYPLTLPELVLEKINSLGYESAYAIQNLAAEPIANGQNCRLMAPTGSGKTLAYLWPLGLMLERDESLNIVVVVSSPELASQIHTIFKEFYSDYTSMLIVGSANIKRQKERLKKKPRFICATAGRAHELFNEKRRLSITSKTILVIDEIDQVIKGRGLEKAKEMISASGQLVVASATYSEESIEVIKKQCPDLIDLLVEEREGEIEYGSLFCNADKKEISLVKLLRHLKLKASLIFVNDIRHTSHLVKVLKSEGVPCLKVDSNTHKNAREQAVKDLRSGKIQALITSDAMARGMDFQEVSVIQYSVARNIEDFIHRSGRAGRAGSKGWCITLVTSKDAFVLQKYSKKLELSVAELKLTVNKKSKASHKKKKSK